MSHYVRVDGEYVRMDDIKSVRCGENGREVLQGEGGVIIGKSLAEVTERVISIIPVTGEWECIKISEDESGKKECWAETIIAWGLCSIGFVVPIIPTEPGGVFSFHALRKVGYPKVYMYGDTYDSADEWLDKFK